MDFSIAFLFFVITIPAMAGFAFGVLHGRKRDDIQARNEHVMWTLLALEIFEAAQSTEAIIGHRDGQLRRDDFHRRIKLAMQLWAEDRFFSRAAGEGQPARPWG